MTNNETARIALITGANRGLGRSAALALAEEGTDIVVTYRSNADEADAVAKEVEALGRTAITLRLDVADTASIPAFTELLRARLTETFGREEFDILVNNAGHALSSPLGAIAEADVRSLLDTHLVGMIMLSDALVPLIADGGRIINYSTGLTRFVGPFDSAVYAAAKGAVEVWTRYLAKELGSRGITVNTIAPGPTGTGFGGGSMRDDENVRAFIGSSSAMGRIGEPQDISAAIAAIASPQLGWVTAQRIEASGGALL